MKKQLLTMALLSWFFGVEHSLPWLDGVKVVMIVGPFASEMICKAERESAIEAMAERPGFKAAPCIERKAA